MTSQTFDGRCAIITGATSGIGRATAVRLAKAGARVVALGRREDRLKELAAEAGANLKPQVLDITDYDAVAALPGLLGDEWQADILVNNAGLALGLAPADQADLEDWDKMVATNVTGLLHITRAYLPVLKSQPRGDVINLSSVAATYPYPGGNVYAGTKAFVKQFSLNLRSDLLGSNVRVCSVEPGMTETEFSVVRFQGDKSKADAVYAGMQPMTEDDIARVIADILALPAHINVNRIELMPVQQAFSPFAVNREN